MFAHNCENIYIMVIKSACVRFSAMLQADDEDDMMEMQMKSPFGSSFRTFNATDYKPIGQTSALLHHSHPVHSVRFRALSHQTPFRTAASSAAARSAHAKIAKKHAANPGSFERI